MSSHLEQFRSFAVYNRGFNEQLYATASTLSDEQRKQDRGAFFGSIHGTLNHILLGDRVWLGRIRRTPGGFRSLADAELLEQVDSLAHELYADFDALRVARSATDEVLDRFVGELSEQRLAEAMRYSNLRGEAREHPLWVALAHLFNHQTHHRGQVTTLLFQLGKDPGVTDYMAWAAPWRHV